MELSNVHPLDYETVTVHRVIAQEFTRFVSATLDEDLADCVLEELAVLQEPVLDEATSFRQLEVDMRFVDEYDRYPATREALKKLVLLGKIPEDSATWHIVVEVLR